jgi:hypothetical protein
MGTEDGLDGWRGIGQSEPWVEEGRWSRKGPIGKGPFSPFLSRLPTFLMLPKKGFSQALPIAVHLKKFPRRAIRNIRILPLQRKKGQIIHI